MKAFLTIALSVLLLPSLFAQADAQSPRVNYAFGLLLGQSLSTTGMTYNLDQVLLGMRDALDKSKKPAFDADRAKEIVTEAIQAVQEKANAAQVAKENVYLTSHGQGAGVVTTASGLQYEILVPGTGAKPTATDTVKVDYVGTLVDGTEFDSSIKRGEPAVFALAQVIPAWTEGIQLMPVGGKYRFTVPSKLAYGDQGAGGVIPPFATLIFEVSLLSIEPAAAEPAPEPAPAQ
jgi:FKBP-type peptidyl-prolyl cis-trans isomerase